MFFTFANLQKSEKATGADGITAPEMYPIAQKIGNPEHKKEMPAGTPAHFARTGSARDNVACKRVASSLLNAYVALIQVKYS